VTIPPADDLNTLFRRALQSGRPETALTFCAASGARTELTFDALDRRADATALALTARGLRSGDRCVVHLANSVPSVDLFLACLRLGVIFVPVNVLYRDRELSHIATDADPALIITAAEHRTLFAADAPVATVESIGAERDRQLADLPGGADRLPSPHVEATASTPAVIIYTSGTTGRAKGAVLTHGNLAANARNIVDAWRITADDRYLGVLPLFHVHGLGNGICAWLATGCRAMLVERFDHAKAAEWFEEFRPTLFFGVPTIYTRLLELPERDTAAIATSMRLFVSGSAPLPAPMHEAFAARFGRTILERYGMSETLMNIGNPYDGERRPGSVGLPFPGVRLRIVDEQGLAVPDGTVAQLEVQGPNVFAEYWRNPDATEKAFRDGWFRTGDMAERSADGYYTLRGRASDLIISGGFNLYPREIEELLLDHPGVHEAAVVAAADDRRGEVPIAYVVADPQVTDETLRALCTENLASFKTPRAFIRVAALPRTALGKVQRHLLPPWDRS
jgi:malonyl-CoA/methylmalonyl-CoA synthetase